MLPVRAHTLPLALLGLAQLRGELVSEVDRLSDLADSLSPYVLERAGLVHRVPDGRVNRCHFDGEPLRDAQALMELYRRHWKHQLGALARSLETGEET